MTTTPDSPGEVAVWTLWIPDHAEAAAGSAWMLDAEEAARAAGFQDQVARQRYVTSHVGLRVLLGGYLGIAPQDVEFLREPCGMPDCEEPHGRPVIAGRPRPSFSLSHAGDAALFAIAESPVGADIESAGLAGDGLAGAGRRLHTEERRAVACLPPALRDRALLGCWVRKEAYFKGLGTGLAAGIGRHHVGLPEELAPAWAPPGPAGWSLVDVPAPAGYQAAVAVRDGGAGNGLAVRVRPLRLP
ncbi:4'-phosphopantetheinyl transferase superfamily protein [Streptomyces sp. FXJ1.172]|uniref:4'-phosphopantetheinyl transferase family protein n=1 Tax=Streptomyces sp. FXJ1.172 TaxID=710705 RepID=UPI000829CD57|nr:4'-phosphopantetheinyl transferase superfamily protein [Streptomyces sp. FXJ1.172]WEO99071.1 4'-phosphopantetheinyl transferase superfamily protein [Streptomyces sp. FXJ1.172]